MAATGRLKNGQMLPSDLISEVTKLCSTMVPILALRSPIFRAALADFPPKVRVEPFAAGRETPDIAQRKLFEMTAIERRSRSSLTGHAMFVPHCPA